MSDQNEDYYPARRFKVPTTKRQYESPYDISSAELQDLIARKQSPIQKTTLNLTNARLQPLEIPYAGQAVVIFGSDGSVIRTVNTTALVWMQFNQFDSNILDGGAVTPNAQGGFPMKHARGFRGPFSRLFLTWPAQAGVWIDLIVYSSKELPWVDGESAT